MISTCVVLSAVRVYIYTYSKVGHADVLMYYSHPGSSTSTGVFTPECWLCTCGWVQFHSRLGFCFFCGQNGHVKKPPGLLTSQRVMHESIQLETIAIVSARSTRGRCFRNWSVSLPVTETRKRHPRPRLKLCCDRLYTFWSFQIRPWNSSVVSS